MFKRQTVSTCDFDWHQLHQLAGEDTDFEAELLVIFLQDAKSSLSELETAIATQNLQATEDAAHSLRGASANIGARSLAMAAGQLEMSARRGDLSRARPLLQQLHHHCRSVQAQLHARN